MLATLLLATQLQLLLIVEVVNEEVLQHVLPGLGHLQADIVTLVLGEFLELRDGLLPVHCNDYVVTDVAELGLF